MRIIYRQLVLVCLASVLHLGEPRGIGTAHYALILWLRVVDPAAASGLV